MNDKLLGDQAASLNNNAGDSAPLLDHQVLVVVNLVVDIVVSRI